MPTAAAFSCSSKPSCLGVDFFFLSGETLFMKPLRFAGVPSLPLVLELLARLSAPVPTLDPLLAPLGFAAPG